MLVSYVREECILLDCSPIFNKSITVFSHITFTQVNYFETGPSAELAEGIIIINADMRRR